MSKPNPSKSSVGGTIGEKTNPFRERAQQRARRKLGGQHSASRIDGDDTAARLQAFELAKADAIANSAEVQPW